MDADFFFCFFDQHHLDLETPGQCQVRFLGGEVGGGEGLGQERLDKTKNRKYRPSEKQKLDPAVARGNKHLDSRFYQLKTGHCLTR